MFSFCSFFIVVFKFLTFTVVLNFFKLDVNSAFGPWERALYKCLIIIIIIIIIIITIIIIIIIVNIIIKVNCVCVWGRGGGGHSREVWKEVCRRGFQTLTLHKNVSFPTLFKTRQLLL